MTAPPKMLLIAWRGDILTLLSLLLLIHASAA
ncbi:hypothetical protein Thi970DRAFT_04258 [Thiorhodovibrio frisius]|uniref:Uncharacterized protein n=1 Tax=Thiorhodovibrio frisius TaxID=631362 RepID=H8Z5N4_9GAMM|nr:hypothetical protein Thi970DRAFT_04258 [Thiorhodovibrio frisius]WPL21353.1 hypothetical protein Thiofri_01478 [Thiorhodovibrio frisius]